MAFVMIPYDATVLADLDRSFREEWYRMPEPVPPGPTSWLRCLDRRSDARLRLYCFPHAGGGASQYRSWARRLPPDVEPWAVQLPGRENRLHEPPVRRLRALVDEFAPLFVATRPGPFVFFGHSLGALIAYELCVSLRGLGHPGPLLMMVSGCRAPDVPDERRVHDLPDAEFLTALGELNGTPDEALKSDELMALILPTLRADFEMSETYTHRPARPLDCPIAIFGGSDDPIVSVEGLEQWRRYSSVGSTVEVLPGSHFYIRSAQEELLRCLSTHLECALARA